MGSLGPTGPDKSSPHRGEPTAWLIPGLWAFCMR
nr:MAG TPA: hypothetical protein [Caudoviricetes sp.]DAX38708.1 MAG TPA: hypothetical protein [Caudoviricetes sp.]